MDKGSELHSGGIEKKGGRGKRRHIPIFNNTHTHTLSLSLSHTSYTLTDYSKEQRKRAYLTRHGYERKGDNDNNGV